MQFPSTRHRRLPNGPGIASQPFDLSGCPYWAGEAEVVRIYWTWPKRTVEADLARLSSQCFKEFWASGVSKHDRGAVFASVLKSLLAKLPDIDIGFDRHDVLDMVEGLRAEFSHCCAFADVYDVLRPAGKPKLNPHVLESWPEEDVLTALRYRHQDQHRASVCVRANSPRVIALCSTKAAR